jgi:hypothetical protein
MNAVLNDDGQQLVRGELWHVRLPGRETVSTMYIRDISLHTVLLEEYPLSILKARYETRMVKFLDKVE